MRKAKWNVLVLIPALALTLLCAQAAAAPRPRGQNHSEQTAKKEETQSVNVYRVTWRMGRPSIHGRTR
jgi:hypothetical protein